MAYEESEGDKEARFVREREKRKFRQAQRDLRKKEKGELKKASGTRERRRIKEKFDKGQDDLKSNFDKSSSGGSGKGGIYDISTNNYSQPPRNQTGQNDSIGEAGEDSLGAADSASDSSSNVEFNGSVLICIDGKPFYIDIPYNPTTGVYSESNGANFPITAP